MPSTLLMADDKFSFRRYLGKRMPGCFYIAHTHPLGMLGGVGVHFGVITFVLFFNLSL